MSPHYEKNTETPLKTWRDRYKNKNCEEIRRSPPGMYKNLQNTRINYNLSAKKHSSINQYGHTARHVFFPMDFSLSAPLLRFQGVANRSWSPDFHGGKLGGGNLDCSTWRLGFSCIEMEQHFRSPQTLKMLSTFIRAVRVYMGKKTAPNFKGLTG